ncbi:MAG TPA: TlpA disulfide reductase family protein [Candidatus Acidoferrales bacterium]|nr:TlpA disulfide reductase family protein [Candidatus Acidoferrales bacterium]
MNRMTGILAAGMLAVMSLGFAGCGGAAPANAGNAASAKASPNANKPNEPDVTFQKLDGAELPLASLKGKVVLVNFWATWCAACQDEIPWMIGFQQKYADQGFTILGVAMDDDGKKVVDPFVEKTQFDVDGQKMAMSYPIIIGNYDLAEKFGGLIGLPTTIVISRDGKVVKRIIGLVDRGELQGIIEDQLKLHS